MVDMLDLQDIQGLIIRGYGNLKAACYVLLAIDDPRAAKLWLKTLSGTITMGQARPRERAINLALTYRGIQKLGLEPAALAMSSNEFITGMATPHRSLLLGDTEESAPTRWLWGGPATTLIDLVLLLFAQNDDTLSAIYTTYGERDAGNPETGYRRS